MQAYVEAPPQQGMPVDVDPTSSEATPHATIKAPTIPAETALMRLTNLMSSLPDTPVYLQRDLDLCGCNAAFKLVSSDGQVWLLGNEESDCCEFCCHFPLHSMQVKLVDIWERELLRLERPKTCRCFLPIACVLCFCPQMHMRLVSSDGEATGLIKQRHACTCACGTEVLDVFGPDGSKRFFLQAHRCQPGPCPCTGCCEWEARIFDAHGQPLTGDSDIACQYEESSFGGRQALWRIRLPQLLSGYDRALLLAAIIFIDYSDVMSASSGGGGGGDGA